MEFGPVIPILRSFDEAKAREFYVDFLGFTIDWTHRFAPDLPLYMQVSRGSCCLHLSEHHGDATPGGAARICVTGLDSFYAEIAAKRYKFARPCIEQTPWQMRELTIKDPFGNRLTFYDDSGVDHADRRKHDPEYRTV